MKKKLTVLALLLALALSLAGCGSAETEEALAAARAELQQIRDDLADLQAIRDRLDAWEPVIQDVTLDQVRVPGEIIDAEPVPCEECGGYGYGIVWGSLYAQPGEPHPQKEARGHLAAITAHKITVLTCNDGIQSWLEGDGWLQVRMLGQDYAKQDTYWVRQGEVLPYMPATEDMLYYPVRMPGEHWSVFDTERTGEKFVFSEDQDLEARMIGYDLSYPEAGTLAIVKPLGGDSVRVSASGIIFPDMETYGHFHIKYMGIKGELWP